ncbi:MAG TPA: FAD-binding oxidoreductase [Kiloniellales bacterium]
MAKASEPKGDADRALIAAVAKVVGAKGLVTDPAEMAPHLVELRGRYRGAALALVKPASTAEVAEVVRLAAAAKVPVVPQGGNTGLVGGQVPPEHGRALLVNLSRMNHIRDLDPVDNTITVEAGCILASVQAAAAEAGRLFPLSLAAEGSCQIGGNLSTNAGGVHVLRYGTMRELVLGLEVVLPDGRVWDGLRRLRKDNTGYDLKQLFIGAEGTLGIITAAVLRLFPAPARKATAFIGLREVEHAMAILGRARALAGDQLDCAELLPRLGLELTLRHTPDTVDPLGEPHPWYLLLELASSNAGDNLGATLETLLAEAYDDGLIGDAAIAASEAQAAAFWRLREALPDAQKPEGGSIKHDISVPVSRIPDFLARAVPLVEEMIPGVRPVAFGHLGDGNLHFNLTQPEGSDREAFLARWDEVNRAVHELVAEMGGSISAEHGVGRMKIEEIKRFKPAVEIELMARLKAALDPDNLMNPGKVI